MFAQLTSTKSSLSGRDCSW